MSFTPDFVIFIFYFVWFLILTFVTVKLYLGNSKILRSGKKESITNLLEEVLKREEENKNTISDLSVQYDKLMTDGKSHIQKIGLVRFNPFKETGGDQSFILALVDAENTGVVISSLHTRTGTRWYAKSVIKGQGAEHELSEDERKALKGAQLLARNN